MLHFRSCEGCNVQVRIVLLRNSNFELRDLLLIIHRPLLVLFALHSSGLGVLVLPGRLNYKCHTYDSMLTCMLSNVRWMCNGSGDDMVSNGNDVCRILVCSSRASEIIVKQCLERLTVCVCYSIHMIKRKMSLIHSSREMIDMNRSTTSG